MKPGFDSLIPDHLGEIVSIRTKKTSKKTKKINMTRWAVLPELSWEAWFGQWVVSSMVLEGWRKTNKIPKQIRLREDCMEKQPDGSALLHYEIDF